MYFIVFKNLWHTGVVEYLICIKNDLNWKVSIFIACAIPAFFTIYNDAFLLIQIFNNNFEIKVWYLWENT